MNAARTVCPECGRSGNGAYCLHWGIAGERKVRTVPLAALDTPEGARERERTREAVIRALLGEFD